MILATHIIFGAAVGSNFQNPLIAFLSGMISHYFLDSFKHWDYSFDNLKNYLKKKENANFNLAMKDLFKIATDFFAGFIVIIYFSWQSPNLIKIIIAGFFGALPDGLQILYFLFPNRFLKIHQEFHDFMHFQKIEKLRLPFGILNQIIALLIAALIFS